MSQSLTAMNPEVYARTLMPILKKESVGMAIANTRFEAMLSNGDTFNKQYLTKSKVETYTQYDASATIADHTATNEYGSVNQSKKVTFKIDVDDRKQNLPDMVAQKSIDDAYLLRDNIDQAVLATVTSASYDVDDGDIGGTAGNSIVFSASNAFETLTQTFAELGRHSVEKTSPWYCCVDYKMAATMAQAFAANGFRIADDTLVNGYTGNAAGLKIYLSENLKSTVSLGIATNPTDGDTVTIKGVTFTFKATPVLAGAVDIGSDAATSVANLVAAINDTGTAGTTYIQLSQDNRATLVNNGVVATDNTTSIGLVGAGRLDCSETLTAAADGFGVETLNCLFGKTGAIDLVTQIMPTVQVRQEPKTLVDNYILHTLYGVKMFTEGALRSGNLKIRAKATTI